MEQIKGDDVINAIIDEVLNPQLSQIIIEAWSDIAQTDRNRERQEVTTPFSVLVRHKYLCSYITITISLALQVSVFAKDHFLDALCLQHLLSQVAGENFSLFFSDNTDR